MAKKLLVSGGKLIRKTPDPQIKTGYGALYNYYTVEESTSKEGFITGYHVPTDAEMTELANYLGGFNIAGGKLKSLRTEPDIEPRWISNNISSDTVNFSALGGGFRWYHGQFANINSQSSLWCDSELIIQVTFASNSEYLWYNEHWDRGFGYSIRVMRLLTQTEINNNHIDGTIIDIVQDYNGNYYQVVKIGTQAWLAQNLRCTNYANGEEIPNVTDDTEWNELTTHAYCWYNNDPNTAGIVYTDEEIVGKKGLLNS